MPDKELIYREDLIAEYDRVHKGPPGGARKLMVDAPAVDAVEVVRCGNCRHRSQYADENGYYSCGAITVPGCLYMVKPDHFCKEGVRRGTNSDE